MLIGREKEIAQLDRCMASDQSEFVIVYGRRRVGKTYLIEQYFDLKYSFSYVGGHKLTKSLQLRNFAKALQRYAHLSVRPVFNDWFDAFDALEDYLASLPEGRKVVFIDEMPWIDTQASSFVEALENFWNGWAVSRRDIVFIASGSATSWMVDKLVENPGGLHARITTNIYLRPFSLCEVEHYLQARGCRWDRYQILQAYMAIGGVPYYLSLLDVKESLVQNIDRLFFVRNSPLRLEFDELYNALFFGADKYITVMKILAQHRTGLTREELISYSKIEGGTLTKVLKNLERCDFILKYNLFGNKKKGAIYRVIDFYTLFYYKFIEPENAQDEQWWAHNFTSHQVEAWQGISFELVCFAHLEQIKNALKIGGIATETSTWREIGNNGRKGAQVDMVISRADRIIHLCEMKFSESPFLITDPYEMKLRERMGVFAESTKSNRTLVNTFVTVFGIKDGVHSSIVHSEVVAADLFKQ